MKTAMQMMYDELLANEYTIPLDLIVKCKELLAMEHKQITKAFSEGEKYEYHYLKNASPKINSYEYYNATFKPESNESV
jgi:hypothetical protein